MDIWRRWKHPRQKPPFGARIDWSDQITDGLFYFLLLNEFVGQKSFGVNENGCLFSGAYFTGEGVNIGQNEYLKVQHPFSLPSYECTFVVRFLFTSWGGNNPGFFRTKAYSNGYDFMILQGVSLLPWMRIGGSDVLKPASGTGAPIGELQTQAYRYKVGAFADWWLNGDLKHENVVSVPSPEGEQIYNIGWQYRKEEYIGGIYHFLGFWSRCLGSEEIERLYYEPYSFFLVPAARIFDLAPASGFTTTQDITWRLFTYKENQLIYNILTDKQASFGYKIFNRKDNSITYRIFTQDGSYFTWKILTSSSQDISYKIFTRLKSDLSWAIASTALSQAITYKIFTRNEVNLSWLILTAEAASLDWAIFTTKEQKAIWNILAQTETDLLWDIYTRKDTTLAYKIFKDLDQDLIYKIFNSTEQDLVWKILAAGLLSEILSWKIYAKQEDGLSWKVFASEQQEFFYKIFNVKEDEIAWLIKREDAADLSWKLFNLKEDPILWKIYSQAEKTLAWSILAALTSQDISYKIFTVKDEELFYNILAEASKSLDWKIYNEKGEELTWRIISEILPEPTYHLKASKRVFVINPTRGIIITKE